MEIQTNYNVEIEIWISTHLSTFEPEISTPRLSQKKGVLIKKSVYMDLFLDASTHLYKRLCPWVGP